jgi:hypothetical protein
MVSPVGHARARSACSRARAHSAHAPRLAGSGIAKQRATRGAASREQQEPGVVRDAPIAGCRAPRRGSGLIVVPRQTSASVAELATSGARVCSAAGPAFVLARASRRDGRVAHRRRVVDPQTQVRDERSATDRDGLDPQRRRHGLVVLSVSAVRGARVGAAPRPGARPCQASPPPSRYRGSPRRRPTARARPRPPLSA